MARGRKLTSCKREAQYSGALAEPVLRLQGFLYHPRSQLGAKYIFDKRMAKMDLLCHYYGSPPAILDVGRNWLSPWRSCTCLA